MSIKPWSSTNHLLRITVVIFAYLTICTGGQSAVIFELTNTSIFGSDKEEPHGQLEVFMMLTGDDLINPPEIFSLNISFEVSGAPNGLSASDFAFGAPVLPSDSHLFTSPQTADFSHTNRVLHAQDIVDQANGAIAFDGARLLIVPFTVSKETLGIFDVDFIPFFNEATDHTFSPLDLTLVGGSVSILAIPEPNSISCFALLSLGLLRNQRR